MAGADPRFPAIRRRTSFVTGTPGDSRRAPSRTPFSARACSFVRRRSIPPELSIVIPVYNEEKWIERVISVVQESLARQGIEAEIITVNDGSRDRTAEVLSRVAGIRFINRSANGGKGAAVKTGLSAAIGRFVLIQDADLEYNPDNYTRILEPLRRGETRVVMGSRFLKEKPVFWGKRKSPYFTHYIGNKLIVFLTNLLYDQQATDYEGCYKAFDRTLVQSIAIASDGFEYDNELIGKILRRGHRVVEVPIDYRPRSYEEGKKINWRHGLRMLWTIVKYRFVT